MSAEPDREAGSETADVLEEAADSPELDVLARCGFAVLALLHTFSLAALPQALPSAAMARPRPAVP